MQELKKTDLSSKKSLFINVKNNLLLKEAFSKNVLLLIKNGCTTKNTLIFISNWLHKHIKAFLKNKHIAHKAFDEKISTSKALIADCKN